MNILDDYYYEDEELSEENLLEIKRLIDELKQDAIYIKGEYKEEEKEIDKILNEIDSHFEEIS